MYKDAVNLRTELTGALNSHNSVYLPIPNETKTYLHEILDVGDYTYARVVDGNATSIIKIENYCGLLIFYNGKFGTEKHRFPCGANLDFIVTPESVESMICNDDFDEVDMINYDAIMWFSTNLTDTLHDIDTDLPIPDDKTSRLVRDLNGKHSYIKLCDGVNVEIAKISVNSGNILLERGVENTEAMTFPKGSIVESIITPMAVRDIICQMECCP